MRLCGSSRTCLLADAMRVSTQSESRAEIQTSDLADAAGLASSAKSIGELRQLAAHCQACDLYKHARQTAFGEGTSHAKVMLVGEQPGDQEDRQGYPFLGPAGKLLDDALESAGINRADVYVTNAVKHFKWSPA